MHMHTHTHTHTHFPVHSLSWYIITHTHTFLLARLHALKAHYHSLCKESNILKHKWKQNWTFSYLHTFTPESLPSIRAASQLCPFNIVYTMEKNLETMLTNWWQMINKITKYKSAFDKQILPLSGKLTWINNKKEERNREEESVQEAGN